MNENNLNLDEGEQPADHAPINSADNPLFCNRSPSNGPVSQK